MRNAIHADLQSQVELLIDTICLGFPVGEKMFWEKIFGGNIFLGKKNWWKANLGPWRKKHFLEKISGKQFWRENKFVGKKNFSRQNLFSRQNFWETKNFLDKFFGKNKFGTKKVSS